MYVSPALREEAEHGTRATELAAMGYLELAGIVIESPDVPCGDPAAVAFASQPPSERRDGG